MEAVDLGQSVPLIPLQVDPPIHRNYRRLLDPIFAPRQMAAREPDITQMINERIDTFIDKGECEFGADFAIPLPSSVFLRLVGLPLSELDMFLEMKDGILRPAGADLDEIKVTQKAAAERVEAYFPRRHRRPPAQARRRPVVDVHHRRGRRAEADRSGDGRHLLPLPHRRTRHRHRQPRVHGRLPGAASGAAAPHRGRSVDHPVRRGGAPAVGDAGDHRAAGGRQRHRSRRVSVPQGRERCRDHRLGQHRRRRAARCLHGRPDPQPQQAPGVRGRRPPVSGVASGSDRAAHRPPGVAPPHPRLHHQVRAPSSTTCSDCGSWTSCHSSSAPPPARGRA